MLVSGIFKFVFQRVVHPRAQFVVNFLHLALLQHAEERRALLIHEAVCRYVLYAESHGRLDVAQPLPSGLARKAVHQVDADVSDAGPPQRLHGPCRIGRLVPAAEKGQPCIVEGLSTHAHPVHRQAADGRRIFGRDVVGIALHRHLCGPAAADAAENLLQQLLGEHARGASTYIYSMYIFACVAAPQLYLAAQRIGVTPVHGVPRGGVESAVDAPAAAERNVDV